MLIALNLLCLLDLFYAVAILLLSVVIIILVTVLNLCCVVDLFYLFVVVTL